MDGYSSEEYDDVVSSESPEVLASSSSSLDSESDLSAPERAVDEDVIQGFAEEVGAPSNDTPLLTAMESAWEEAVPIHQRQDYETLVGEGGSAAFIGITMVRNWVHRLLFRTAQYLRSYARAYMRFCRSVAALLRRSTSWMHPGHKNEKDY